MIWQLIARWCVPPRALEWGRLTKGDPIRLWLFPTWAEIAAGTDLMGYVDHVGIKGGSIEGRVVVHNGKPTVVRWIPRDNT